jgi:uncharacterized protein (TIGR02757 family)
LRDLSHIKALLDKEVELRNTSFELSDDKPDPLMVAREYRDEYISLLCALYAYGNAKQIVKFISSLDFSLLECSEDIISKELKDRYYRFQKSDDVVASFIALKRLKEIDSIENIFFEGYRKDGDILDGLWHFISTLRAVLPRDTHGYNFLVGSVPKKLSTASPYKRYMMYLRWMVRDDNLDMGLWSKIDKRDLIMPLDTHTFKMSQKLGLLDRKSYDLKSAIELSRVFRSWDESDPIKYDFALYRIGQEKISFN